MHPKPHSDHFAFGVREEGRAPSESRLCPGPPGAGTEISAAWPGATRGFEGDVGTQRTTAGSFYFVCHQPALCLGSAVCHAGLRFSSWSIRALRCVVPLGGGRCKLVHLVSLYVWFLCCFKSRLLRAAQEGLRTRLLAASACGGLLHGFFVRLLRAASSCGFYVASSSSYSCQCMYIPSGAPGCEILNPQKHTHA